MEIVIRETGERGNLDIIDPATGTNWTNDLMGNYGALPEYDDEIGAYLMTQEDFDWWSDLIERYQAAIDKYCEVKSTLDGEEYDRLVREVGNIDCDLEDYPTLMQEIIDGFIYNQPKREEA